ncbi:MAG: allophanate hydrolase subunit 1 [Gemmatimonadetes bacterium]|nr:allophanate hydrolase subunit 1 [Gemmatimonadota bacterium]MDE2678224.1 allophanate hydrolase subunit 1 [Gemmatimonadota bacterium]MXX35912.1 allophanate hydrolase subunit 1 [Gemmatimonadota bacterium]MYA12603.1 allophanate hydrolase subunit 1 [Gemmatimonadota bacterium]MYD14444.1 allophanate hydrolase subunit 1 [Gemmatimonadota bacterium]
MITFPGPASALVTLPVAPDRDGIARVLSLERFAQENLPGVRATIPAFNRLLVEGTPRRWDPAEVASRLEGAARDALQAATKTPKTATVSLPVCYDLDLAPDLEQLATRAQLTAREVARLHSAPTYLVLATGFAPGFAYLGDVDARIAMPRRPSPRARVPQGAVGIADRRTGVYPTAGPGGWQLVGRVPPALFEDAAERIARFTPGGPVEFQPIGRKDYEAECG